MIKLRILIGLLTGWLIFFFNIERVATDIDITKYFYIVVALVLVVLIIFRDLVKLPSWLIYSVPIAIFLVVKFFSNQAVWGNNLPITITEIFGLLLSVVLIRMISLELLELNQLVSQIAINYVGKAVQSFDSEQGILYNELKRAKLYNRPLSVMTLKLDPGSLADELPNIVDAFKKSLANQMAIAKVARILDQELYGSDIIVQRNDALVLLLPELDEAHIDEVRQRLRQAIEKNTGLKTQMGMANYPKDALTFESLLSKAEVNLNKKTIETDMSGPNTQDVKNLNVVDAEN